LLKHSGTIIPQGKLKQFITQYYLRLSGIADVSLPEEYGVREVSLLPTPRIYLRDYDDTFSIELKLLYQNSEAGYRSGHDIVIMDKSKLTRIVRNRDEEDRLHSILLDNHITLKNNVMIPAIDPYLWLSETTKSLISEGFEIFGIETLLNQRINHFEPELRVEVSSGIDWFDLKGEVRFGKESILFGQLLESMKNHENFIRLSDGSMGMIPKKWLNRLSGVAGLLEFDKQRNFAKASQCHINLIESILEISSKSKIDASFRKLREKFKKFREIENAVLPVNLNGELREYQKGGYSWLHFLHEFSFGGCLADDMGLGKTVQVLSLLLSFKERGITETSLIVVPTSLVFNWMKEASKFAPKLNIYMHYGIGRQTDLKQILKTKPDIVLTSYGTLRNDIWMFRQKQFHYVILDESQ
jgi:non-specific serine/threonine protein kinase